MKGSSPISRPWLWFFVSIAAAATMAWYVISIWSFNQPPHFSDLYARWWGAHELLLHGRNPYSPEIAHEIQTVIYGAPLSPSPDDPSGIGGGFAYPPYVAFLLWPSIYLSFSTVRLLFFCISLPVVFLSLELWLRSLRFRLSLVSWITVAFFLLGSFPALQAIKLQNLSLIVAALIALAFFFLSTGRLTAAGIALAISTFKPQFTILLIPWLLLWISTDWRRRQRLAWSFLATMLVLISASEWFVRGWIPTFLNVARAYRHYTYGHSVLDVWFTPAFGVVAAAALLVAALVLCWRYRSESADSPKFFLASCLVLAATVVVIPTLAPHAQLLLLPGFLCLLKPQAIPQKTVAQPSNPQLSNPSTLNPFTRLFRVATWMLLAWPWIAAFALVLAALRYPVASLLRFWQVPLYSSPLLPVAVFIVLGSMIRSSRAIP